MAYVHSLSYNPIDPEVIWNSLVACCFPNSKRRSRDYSHLLSEEDEEDDGPLSHVLIDQVTAEIYDDGPTRVELVPGVLYAEVSRVIMPSTIDNNGSSNSTSSESDAICWCCVTQGLVDQGQPELAVLLKSSELEMCPRDILTFLRGAAENKTDQMMRAGNFTEFGSKFLGSEDNVGFVYAAPHEKHNLSALPLPRDTPILFAILVKRGEIEWARAMSTRLLVRLGHETNCYPHPIISDRDRRPVFNGIGNSFLVGMDFLKPRSGRALNKNNQIILEFPTAIKPHVASTIENLPDITSPMLLLMSIHAEADSHLTFSDGSQNKETVMAISYPGSTGQAVAGSFVLLVPGKEDNGATIAEDGFLVKLTQSAFNDFLEAMKLGIDFEIAQSESCSHLLSFKASWFSNDFNHPQ